MKIFRQDVQNPGDFYENHGYLSPINWGIEDVNYKVDENGKRYRTEEGIEQSKSDKDYSKKTGAGFHAYPFPVYGNGVEDSNGNTYTTASKEAVMAEYNEEQNAACEAWGTELLVDVFPQADEFDVPKYSAVWAYTKPSEFDEIANKLDEVAWSSLVSCVIGSEADFDANYDAMLKELEDTGMADAEEMLTDIIKERVALSEE